MNVGDWKRQLVVSEMFMQLGGLGGGEIGWNRVHCGLVSHPQRGPTLLGHTAA